MPPDTESVATITAQVPTYDVGAQGTPVAGYAVYFSTKNGAKGSVFIPKAGYNADAVRAAVRSHALELDAVQGAQV